MKGSIQIIILSFFLLGGCTVNRASYDPFSFAPDSPCGYWKSPKEKICLSDEDCPLEVLDLPKSDHPLSLAEVIDIGLLNNPDTRVSWAQARYAAAEYGKSQSPFFPDISIHYFFETDRTSYLASQVEQPQNVIEEGLIINTQSQWGPRAKMSWTLLDFGQRRYTSLAAQYALYEANYIHNETLRLVIEHLSTDYYTYLYQEKLLEAYEADLVDAKDTLLAASLGLEKGVKDLSDKLQAKTQMLLVEMNLASQKSYVKEAYANLLTSMGLPANCDLELQKMPFVKPNTTNLCSLDQYLQMAMEDRPDLLAQKSQLESAKMSLSSAKRLWVPVLDYSIDIGETSYEGGFSDDYNYVNTFSISMPLFTGFSIRNSIRKATAKVEQSQAELRKTKLQVVEQVTISHYNVSTAKDTLLSASAFLEAAKEEYKVAIAQYRRGTNTILDVLSAQSSLFDARAKQADATKLWFVSLAELTFSSGMLCYNLGDIP